MAPTSYRTMRAAIIPFTLPVRWLRRNPKRTTKTWTLPPRVIDSVSTMPSNSLSFYQCRFPHRLLSRSEKLLRVYRCHLDSTHERAEMGMRHAVQPSTPSHLHRLQRTTRIPRVSLLQQGTAAHRKLPCTIWDALAGTTVEDGRNQESPALSYQSNQRCPGTGIAFATCPDSCE